MLLDLPPFDIDRVSEQNRGGLAEVSYTLIRFISADWVAAAGRCESQSDILATSALDGLSVSTYRQPGSTLENPAHTFSPLRPVAEDGPPGSPPAYQSGLLLLVPLRDSAAAELGPHTTQGATSVQRSSGAVDGRPSSHWAASSLNAANLRGDTTKGPGAEARKASGTALAFE